MNLRLNFGYAFAWNSGRCLNLSMLGFRVLVEAPCDFSYLSPARVRAAALTRNMGSKSSKESAGASLPRNGVLGRLAPADSLGDLLRPILVVVG